MKSHRAVPIISSADLSTLHGVTFDIAHRAGLPAEASERLDLIVSELATNLLRHTPHGGRLLLRQIGASPAVECISLDQGPGIRDLAKALGDGNSTIGGLGLGLGAIRRLSQSFSIHSDPGAGTAVLARVGAVGAETGFAFQAGVVMLPMPGMVACGDGWLLGDAGLVVVVDGLGHGEFAAEAARKAEAAARMCEPEPRSVLLAIHAALRGTRGAVGAAFVCGEKTVRYSGVGNIAATLMRTGSRTALLSAWGVLGHNAAPPATREIEWSEGDVLLLNSDGVGDVTRVFEQRCLRFVHPTLTAAIILRDGACKLDDQTVLAVQR